MASLITGYEYDIFISYRQKDNKGDRWVSEFVEALKTELESTFKEDVSVYFDINPHDGLLETHEVDASLKEKLKCLIFIPIISRTYCDPNSFAWNHEFKPFVDLASGDQFGLKVRLPGGNVASRVLPVRIHDLDTSDIKLCESILGGVMRGIEFIYKEPGVNKPLVLGDDERKNLNNTKYRIQINKVANAIDEIIRGLKINQTAPVKEKGHLSEPVGEIYKLEKQIEKKNTAMLNKRRLLPGVAILVILIFAVVLTFPKVFHSRNSKITGGLDGKMSIVVNTFENKTGDVTMDPWKDIIPDLLRGYLATSKELSVQNSQIMFEVYESMKLADNKSFEASQSNEVAKKLKADFYLTGNFQKLRNKSLMVLNLNNTKSREVLLTRSVEGDLDTEYKKMTDSLSKQVKSFLEIKVLEKSANPEYGEAFTNSVEAYRKYIEGMKSIMKGDYQIATKALREAYRLDSTFTIATFYCAFAYCFYDSYQAGIWVQKAYVGKERLPVDYQMWLEQWHAGFTNKDPKEMEVYANSIEKSDTKSRYILFDVGCAFTILEKYDKSVNMFEKAALVSSEWGDPWKFRDYYTYFADACRKAGEPDKEARVLKTGLKLFPDDIKLIWRQARLALSDGTSNRAKEIIDEYENLCKRYGVSKSEIAANLGSLFDETDSLIRAEEYYRQALALEPDNAFRLNDLAYFLIDRDRNINDGLKFVEKALEIKPDNCDFIDTKGWGLYKQGKYEEALKLLEKSWDLSPSLDWIYIYLHLQEVKKAIANRK